MPHGISLQGNRNKTRNQSMQITVHKRLVSFFHPKQNKNKRTMMALNCSPKMTTQNFICQKVFVLIFFLHQLQCPATTFYKKK